MVGSETGRQYLNAGRFREGNSIWQAPRQVDNILMLVGSETGTLYGRFRDT
jgi:hypothetical protein